ncbi:peptidylprolyl isomerase [Parasalinivibrio latis]|uniref:peptidylprolyl isomerase n=1 Tax=Parasalinivibrio latis TaxID=2952610 RepID=UPI0030E5B34D
MMERLREGANNWVIKVILGLIIISFAFAGVGSYLAGGNDVPAATVGDQDISRAQFEQVYQNERARMQQQAGEMFSTLMSDPAYLRQFRQNVLDRMVNDMLLEQYANELNLRVSDVQIKQAIVDMPQFQRDGKFDNELYQAGLRRAGFTPDQFAEYMRKDLVRQQLVNALLSSEFVLGDEIQSQYDLVAQTRAIRTLTLPVATFAEKANITDEEMKAFYDKNSGDFVRPEQIKASFVELSGDKLADNIKVTDEEAKAYYDANKANYESKAKRKVSHILIQGDDADAKAKAEAVLADLKAGKDFAAEAKAKSDDTFSAKDGGSLDWIEKGVMDPSFEEAAFALKNKGDISGLVKSEFGYHIIKLDDVEPAVAKPFDEVKDSIVAALKQQKAADRFYEMSTELSEKAFEMPDNLDDAAKAVNAKVQKTDFFSRQDAQGVMANPKVLEALFSPEVREDGLNSEVIEIAPEHVVVVRVDDSRDETVLPFDEVKAQVKAKLAAQKGEQEALALADKIVAGLKEGNKEALDASGYSFGDEETVGRVGADRAVTELAFTMAKPVDGKPVYGRTENAAGDVIIVELDKVNEPGKADMKPTDPMAQSMVRAKANADLDSTLGQLRSKTEVTVPAQNQEEQL